MTLLKWPFYIAEVFLFSLIFIGGHLLPFKAGSALGGWIACFIGPLLPVNRIARINIHRALPHATPQDVDRMIKGMWENIGRTIFEYFKLPTIDPLSPQSPYEIRGIENLDLCIHDQKPGLLFTAHMGHWEIGNYIALRRGLKLAQVTRFLNNPLLRAWINHTQGKLAHKVINKGKTGIWEIVASLKQGGHVSMMLDQKMNEGVAIPFFGYKAMTAPAIAKLALRFNCPILPVQVERMEGIKCRVTYHPPLQIPTEGSEDEKTYQLLLQINQHIESWIREAPEQWFWVHKRWGKEVYRAS